MNMLTKENRLSWAAWQAGLAAEGEMLLIDKAVGWTSFDVVAKLRGLLRVRRIGHAGTLDKLATGLLIVGVGKGTAALEEYQRLPKEYVATLRLGATTVTDDAEAPEENLRPFAHVERTQIEEVLREFIGTIAQVPPLFAALKQKGERFYALARQGRQVERAPRPVVIHAIELLQMALPYATIRVRCAKGTYIRALARDIGERLGCGAYVTALRRTAIGEHRVESAFTMAQFAEWVEKGMHGENGES